MSDKRLRVLVVEDSDLMRKCLLLLLSGDSTIDADGCATLHETIQKIGKGPPVDVILLDLFLPDAQNLEGLAALRKLAPQTSIVVVTGMGGTVLREQAMIEGARGFLEKGDIGEEGLLKAIRDAVAADFAPNWTASRHRSRTTPTPNNRPSSCSGS
jgi:glutamate dehydrogenase (NAD(P)+)